MAFRKSLWAVVLQGLLLLVRRCWSWEARYCPRVRISLACGGSPVLPVLSFWFKVLSLFFVKYNPRVFCGPALQGSLEYQQSTESPFFRLALVPLH